MEKPKIQIVSHEEYKRIEEQETKLQSSHPQGEYETWRKLDIEMDKVAGKYGKVGYSNPDTDFYTSGDWFHQYGHGFCIWNPKVLSKEMLYDFYKVAKQNHEHTCLWLDGEDYDDENPKGIENLQIFITPRVIAVSWFNQDAVTCRKRLKQVNINLE